MRVSGQYKLPGIPVGWAVNTHNTNNILHIGTYNMYSYLIFNTLNPSQFFMKLFKF